LVVLAIAANVCRAVVLLLFSTGTTNFFFGLHLFIQKRRITCRQHRKPNLPSGNLVFSFIDGLKTPEVLRHQKGEQLVHCITGEIAEYLDMEVKSC
jgi:hypothetical protein